VEIKYINRESGRLEIEKVYGEKMIKWLYSDNKYGKFFENIISFKIPSILYGLLQNAPASKNKIEAFIDNYKINMEEFAPEDGQNHDDPYSSFNMFFIRKFNEGRRVFVNNNELLSAFAEARYFGFKKESPHIKLPVKGEYLSIENIISHNVWAEVFQGGPILIARLCPVDYHRFHFPDAGKILDKYRVHGKLHSVNPIALRAKEDIFFTNEREVTILESENFGKLAYIEVGAAMVGKIVQTYREKDFKRGDEKGYFLFGGSTVILIGEKNKWHPSEDIFINSSKGLETYIKLGDSVGKSL